MSRTSSRSVGKWTRYSGDFTLRIRLLESAQFRPHGFVYRVAISRGHGKPAVVRVGPPAHLAYSVDAPVASDSAAHAALSFAADEGWLNESHAANTSHGWHVGRTKATAWPRDSSSMRGQRAARLHSKRRDPSTVHLRGILHAKIHQTGHDFAWDVYNQYHNEIGGGRADSAEAAKRAILHSFPGTHIESCTKICERLRDPSRKFERCVRKVKHKRSRVNPWAVCHKSVGRDPSRTPRFRFTHDEHSIVGVVQGSGGPVTSLTRLRQARSRAAKGRKHGLYEPKPGYVCVYPKYSAHGNGPAVYVPIFDLKGFAH